MRDDKNNNAEVKCGVYRHFKGNEYEVIGIADHSETGEELVVYRSLGDKHNLWVRPKTMFLEKVNKNGYHGPRFKFIK